MATAAEPYESFQPGQVIASKYVVERVIGVGGVGVVLAARHIELDEMVAIKLLLPEMQSRPDIVARFANEARAAVRIKSEYAARVFDVGVLPDRGPYFVMEYLEGETLAAVLERGPVASKRAVELMLQVCEALAVAHASGIIHRDIKPENLFLARRGDGTEVMKVLDFGISKAALGYGDATPASRVSRAPSSNESFKTQELMGTPLYMSPEQIRSTANVDHRSDIWSLGVVFYEMLSCQIPFSGETVPKICARVLETEPAPLQSYAVSLPPGLDAVIDRCFQKDPDKRFQNVAELAIALLPFGPTRARVFAERASSILEASGHVQGVTFRFSSAPPSGSLDALVPPIPSAPRTPRFASGTAPIHVSHQPIPTTLSPEPLPSSMPPEAFEAIARESQKTRRTIVAVVAVVVGLMGLATTALLSRAEPALKDSPSPAASVLLSAPAVAESSTPAIGSVTISLGAKPSDARLYLDDTLLPSNPLKRVVMRDGQPHAVRAEAFGYVTRSIAITFDSDKEVVLALDRAPVAAAVPHKNVATRAQPPTASTPPTNPIVVAPALPKPTAAPVPTIGEVELPKTKKSVRPVDTTQPW